MNLLHLARGIAATTNQQHGVMPLVYRVRADTWVSLERELKRKLNTDYLFTMAGVDIPHPNFAWWGVAIAPWPDHYGT